MKTYKAACSREPFTLDWADFYDTFGIDPATKPITSSTWVISEGIMGPDFVNSDQTTLTIEGGTKGVTLTAENSIEINNGEYKDCRTIYIEVF